MGSAGGVQSSIPVTFFGLGSFTYPAELNNNYVQITINRAVQRARELLHVQNDL